MWYASRPPISPILMNLLADIRPLQASPEFRRLWIGQMLSTLGGQMTGVAVAVQIYALTESSLAVGMIGLAVGVPLLTLGLLGGSFADAVDRRKLVLLTSSLLAVVALGFVAQAALDLRQVWPLYALLVLQSCLTALDTPARRTFMPRLLPPTLLPAAAALAQLAFRGGVLVGPLIGGIIIASVGLVAAYAVDALTFIVALHAVRRLRAMPVEGGGTTPSLRAVVEGLRYLRHQPVLATVLLADINATVLGFPRALFPALAETQFGGGAETVGLLSAAFGIGGLVAGAVSGPLSHVRRQGRAVLLAIAVWAVASACFALTSQLWLAVTLLAVAGAADMVSGVYRATILQLNTPDALLGRISGVGFVVGVGVPRLGDVRAGVVAALTSPVFSAVSGGLACLAGVALLAWAVPAFRRYEAKR
jgi:MFS family permease